MQKVIITVEYINEEKEVSYKEKYTLNKASVKKERKFTRTYSTLGTLTGVFPENKYKLIIEGDVEEESRQQ